MLTREEQDHYDTPNHATNMHVAELQSIIHAGAISERLLRKWTLQTINSPNTIVCDLGLESHHAVDVIGLHGLVWSEGSETSVSYDLLLLLPGTLHSCPRQNVQTGTSLPSRVDRRDRMNHDPGTDFCLTIWFLHGSGHSGHRLAALTFMVSTVQVMSVSLHAG